MNAAGWVEVNAPAWIWGGDLPSMFDAAEMEYKPARGGTSMFVRTQESYYRTQPNLVRLIRAAGPDASKGGLTLLGDMSDDSVDADVRSTTQETIEQLQNDSAPDLLKMAVFYQLVCASIPSSALPAQGASILEELKSIPMEGGETAAFPDAGLYAIKRSDALLYRLKLMSVMLRIQHDERLAAGDLSHLLAEHDAGIAPMFGSGAALHTGFYLLDPYVGVVLGALTPAIWGFSAHRGRGPVIFSLGRQIAGSSATAPELLRTLPTQGADRVTEFAVLPPDAVPSALRWWTKALNSLFGVITDWSVFADDSGRYQPAAHLQVVATVEQLFRRVLSIQSNHNDLNARRVLLFTVLDTIEALTGQSIELLCDASFARKRLEDLEVGLGTSAGALLLPRAARAVEALEEVQEGFFIKETDGSILLAPSTNRTASPREAAAQYLKLLRNATHGHGTNRARQVEMTNTLLARHTGRIPHDIALLGWLYLVSMLDRPDAIRSHLRAGSLRLVRGR